MIKCHHVSPTSIVKKMLNKFSISLRQAGFSGEIERDSALLASMSTDNSVYQISPDLVVAPHGADDLVKLLRVLEDPRFCNIAVTARGGGTGTNGQSLNRGVIVDMRRHMNGLVAFDPQGGWAEVEPGMVLDDLNEQIRSSGWFFAPETSTSTRCTIGGMVSTDASGKGSRVYGKTSDNILGLEIARPEGLLSSSEPTPDWAKGMLASAEGAARKGRKAFVDNTPRLNRRFTGYDLERACPTSGVFEWWRLFLGAEGTLGLISRIRIKLRRIETEKRLLVAGFDCFRSALASATPLLAADPTAIEVMDETVQAIAQQAGILARLPIGLRPDNGQRVAYTFIEINGNDRSEVEARLEHCRRILLELPGMGSLHSTADLAEIREIWAVRSAGVGLLGKVDGPARPIAFVEDAVVPPENLPPFLDEFLATLTQYGLGFGIYGHVDVGCLHIRPALNIDSEADKAKLVAVSDAIFSLTRKYGGIFWGEHGKGVRGAYLEQWIGANAYIALQGVKAALDPDERYNPGKLVSNNARILGIGTTPFRRFNGPKNDALTKAFRCNGNAQCLSYAASTPMCPSYKVSGDLRHSPKGRADALRAWHVARTSESPELASLEADLKGVLDTCLGCKACASSCPVQVDIPAMRSVFLADYHRRHARRLVDRLVLLAERRSPAAVKLVPALAPIWSVLSYIGGWLTGHVDMPSKLATRLPRPLSDKELSGPLPNGTVILVQDWFTALFDAQVQRDVLAGFTALGYKPRLLQMQPAGKTAHAAGDLKAFRTMAESLAASLSRAAATGAPLVAFEPAFGMMLRQEYVQAGIKVPQVLMPQEFLAKDDRLARMPALQSGAKLRLLSHCTEATALPDAARQWRDIFAALGVELEAPTTGCCGMAGLFGHQKRHQDWSRKLFKMSWRRHLQDGVPVVATGFSCRSQTQRLDGSMTRHPLGQIAELLQVCEGLAAP